MKPWIICHMLASVDGKIDGASLRSLTPNGEYEATGAQLSGDAWVCGRVTMEQHFATGVYQPSDLKRAAKGVHVVHQAKSYAVVVDTKGTLLWDRDEIDGDHLVVITSEQATESYLGFLKQRGISYVVAGSAEIDLPSAVSTLRERFGMNTLLLEGGGNINGGFLDADLVDELSLLLIPGIDGRHEIPNVFDGLSGSERRAVPLKLKSVERRERDVLWLRYEVLHAGEY